VGDLDVDGGHIKRNGVYNDRESLDHILKEYFVPRSRKPCHETQCDRKTHEAPL
jgi:hypothetical protein